MPLTVKFVPACKVYQITWNIPTTDSPDKIVRASLLPAPDLFEIQLEADLSGPMLTIYFSVGNVEKAMAAATMPTQLIFRLEGGPGKALQTSPPIGYNLSRSLKAHKYKWNSRVNSADVVTLKVKWQLDPQGKAAVSQPIEKQEITPESWIGIDNMGTTCYLACILQMMSRLPMCLETIFGQPDEDENKILSALCSHVAGLRRSKHVITPRKLLDMIDCAKAGRKGWNRNEQQDMVEIFDFILDSMKNTSKGKSLYDLFTVQWKTHYPHTGKVEDEQGHVFTIEVDGDSEPSDPTFDSVLRQMKNRETEYMSITNLPGAIFFWLNLGQQNGGKKRATLRLPAELDLSVGMREHPAENSEYVLYAIVEHMSGEATRGHYKIYIHDLEAKEGQAQWVICNDPKVTVCNPTLQDGVLSFGYRGFQIAGFVYLRKEMVQASQARWNVEKIPSKWIEQYEEEYKWQEDEKLRKKREAEEIHVSLYSSQDFLVDNDKLLSLKLEPKYKGFTILKSDKQELFRQKLCELAPDLNKDRMLIYNCWASNNGRDPVPTTLLQLSEEKLVDKLWTTDDKTRRVFLFEGDAGVNPSSSVLVMFKFYTQDPENPVRYLGCKLLDRSQTDLVPLVNQMLGRPVEESHEYLVFKETMGSDHVTPVEDLSALFKDTATHAVILVFQDPPKEDFTIEPGVVDSAMLCPDELRNLYSNLILRKYRRRLLVAPFSAILSRGAFPPIKVCYSPSLGDQTIALALGLESFDTSTSKLLYYPFGSPDVYRDYTLSALKDNGTVFVRKMPACNARFRRDVDVKLEWNGSKRKSVMLRVVFPPEKDCCFGDVVAQLKQEELLWESFRLSKMTHGKNGTIMEEVTDMDAPIFDAGRKMGSVVLVFEISSQKVIDRVQNGQARLVRVSSADIDQAPEQFNDVPRLLAIQRKDTWESVKRRLASQVRGTPVRYEWRTEDDVTNISDDNWSFDAIPEGARLVPVVEPPALQRPGLMRTDALQ